MKRTFLILLVLFCVASMAVSSVSAASDDIATDIAAIDDNAINEVSLETDDSISDSIQAGMDDSDDKSLESAPLKEGASTIYVSKTGDDSNDGLSEENAVATIAKGYELAGDGSTINIGAGTYDQSSSITLDKSITFNGADGAVINRAGTSSVFVYTGDDAKTFTLNNLILKAPIAQNNPMINIGGAGILIVNNCKMTDNVPGKNGAIKLYGDLTKATFDNCEFYDMNGSSSSSASYITIMGKSVVDVKNSIFHDIIIPTGSFFRAPIYVNSADATGTVSNCKFYNISGNTMGVIDNKAGTLTVSNSSFENISLNGGNSKGIIYVSQTTAVGNTLISGNSFHDNDAAYAIWISAAPTTAEYNAFDLAEGQYAIGNNKQAEVNANYNFYGTNDNPSALLDNVTASNWVIMSASASADSVATGDSITITADFSKYTDGTTTGDVTGTMAEVPVKFTNADDTKGSLADEILYQDNKAIVTYTGVAEGADTITVTAASASTTIPITVIGGSAPAGNVIYVKPDGNDENDGLSEATAVGTIARAVEIVGASQGTDFTILVSNGDYYISKIESPEAKNVNLIGESRDGVILHASGTYGINVYEDDVSWNIEKVTICDLNNTAGTSAAVRFLGNGTSSMNDCVIKNITAKNGALYLNTKGTVNISNTIIENIYGATSSSASSIYVYDSGTFNFDNIEVSGCTLDESVAGTSTAYYLRAVFYLNDYSATVNLFNSRIIDNVGPMGAIIESRAKFNVINTTIANNYVKTSTNGNNGGEYLIWASHDNSVINVSNSVIANNTLGKSTKGVFYAQKGSTNVEYSAIYNNLNSDESAAALISGSLITADYDWWGTNEKPSSSVDKWVIMNVDPTSKEGIDIGDTVTITVDFNHYTDSTGTVYDLEGSIPELAVTASAATGALDKSEAITENGIAQFTYTAAAGGEDTANIASGAANVPIAIVVNAPVAPHDVYVSKDGNDENDGSEESPVATIAKAIEIATGDAGTGKIFVNAGTYTENNFEIIKNLEIIGIGDVIIDGNNEARIFTVNSTTENFTLRNIAITKANRNYGSVIYSTGANILLDNVTLYENQATGGYSSVSVIYANGGSLEIDNSVIANHSADGMIYISSASLIINNTVFDNNNANLTDSGTMGFIFATGTSSVTIESSNFTNNIDRQGLIYDSSRTNNLVIKDSLFDNNVATVGAGGVVHSDGKVNIANSVFTNNKAGREGGAIFLSKNADANITKSVFINNTCANYQTDYNGDAISSAGKLTINYSVILAKEGSSKVLLFNANEDNAPNANYNWWGTNNSPVSLVGADSYYDDWEEEDVNCPMPDVSKWVIMGVNSNLTAESINLGDEVEITVDFNHYTDGTTTSELVESIPEVDVKATATLGSLDKAEAITENGQAKFVYTGVAAGEDIVNVESGAQTVPIAVNVVSNAYEGIIYVSKDGSDSNNGAEDAPVATIAKAVELAQAGSGQIIIKEGTYNENNITINSTGAMSITGEGNVVIDGTGLESNCIFTVLSSVVSFDNIAFANNNGGRYGSAIKASGSRSGLLLINIIINNCKFDNLVASSRGGAIFTEYTKGNLIINNSVFTNNNGGSWGGALGITYSAYENGLNLKINNSNFVNNVANNGGAGYLMAEKITIENSNFTDNSAINGPGVLELYNCTATINNCILVNNSAKSQGTAIKIESVTNQPIATLNITNSIIENNKGTEGKAPAIFVDKATLYVSYSSIVNEHNLETKTSTGYDAIYGQGIAIANNNWWGTNDPTSLVNGTNITIDKWVIMNVDANATDVLPGDEVKVTVDFNHVMTSAGEIEELAGGVIPKEAYTVTFAAENGTVIPETLTINNGESGNAVFTASDANAKVTATCAQATKDIVFVGEIPEPYTGIVYVSPDGSDRNNGSAEAPVASIAKAIQIATAETGSGQIVIKEGTYKGNGYQITKDLTITGEGNVVIDGEGQGRLFNVSSDASKFSLINVVLTGANHGYGAAVYSFAKETVLDNVTIVNNPGAGDLITTYGNLTIKDSEVSGHNGGDVIQTSGDATIIINNTLFKDNEVTASTSDYGIIYVSSGKANVIIENSKFYNNKARQGIVIGSSDANITVKGSEFINNTNTVSYGGAIRASNKLDVTESVFINNNAYRDGGAIYIGFRGDATITKSMFVNNSAGTSYNGDAIYNGNKATVNYCILLTNTTGKLIFNDGEDNVVNAQYNWWGTNDNPKSLTGSGTYEDDYGYDEIDCAEVDVSNWIIMNVVADTSNVQTGAQVPIAVDFNHYLDSTTNEIKELDTKLAQELTVDFASETGSLDKTAVETVGLVAQSTYTAAEGQNSISVKSSDASVGIEFNALTPKDTILSLEDEITVNFGEGVLNVSLTSEGSPVAGKTITVKVNDEINLTGITDESGIASIDLSSVPVGSYNAEISFAGDSNYNPASATVKVNVKEAPKTSEDLQKLIDETPEGGVLNLSNMEFVDISGINITKDIAIVADNVSIATAGDGNPVFNIASNVSNVSISGVEFIANNGDVLVKATSTNGTDDLSIVNPAIELTNNTVSPANENVVPSSITLFELESERAVLAPSNPINIKDNNLPEGAKAFDFEIAGLNDGNGINIPQGGNINTNGSSGGTTPKVATTIVAKAMKTTTVNTKINGKKAGKNYSITLKDSKGNVLAGKQVLISFNGKIYKRTTNAKGVATIKIALTKKGTYPVVVSFLGDEKYNGSFVVAKVKVNPQKVKLTVAKKTYKRSKKTKYLYATLKATNKKAIKGKKLVFIINKKKYTAKTNKKGVAKVKVKLSKRKTYKFTVKFLGDNTFKKISKKGKVKIK